MIGDRTYVEDIVDDTPFNHRAMTTFISSFMMSAPVITVFHSFAIITKPEASKFPREKAAGESRISQKENRTGLKKPLRKPDIGIVPLAIPCAPSSGGSKNWQHLP